MAAIKALYQHQRIGIRKYIERKSEIIYSINGEENQWLINIRHQSIGISIRKAAQRKLAQSTASASLSAA